MNMKKLQGLVLCLAVVFLGISASADTNINVRSVDASNWPELRIEAKLPGEFEKTADYEVIAGDKNVAARSLHMIQKIEHADNLLIAVDTSRSLGNDHMAAIKAALGDYIRHLGKDEQMALLSFNDSVQLVAGFTHEKNQIADAVGQLKQEGKRTELYKAINAGIDLLKNLPGDRSLFVISDGHDEGTGITAEALAQKAAEHAVSIHAVGLPDKSSKNVTYLSSLEIMARQTKGRYQLAESPLSLSSAIFTLLTARRDAKQADYFYEILFDLKDVPFSKAGETQCLLVRKTPAGEERAAFSASIPEQALPEQFSWWKDKRNQMITAGVAAALLLVLLVLFMMRRNRRKAREAMRLQEEQFAALQNKHRESPFILDFAEMGLSFTLPYGRLTLGATGDNAIVIDEPTVSRKHAVITVTVDNCTIEDTNSTNGIEVNGERINRPVILKLGDKLRFGNAEAIYRKNKGA